MSNIRKDGSGAPAVAPIGASAFAASASSPDRRDIYDTGAVAFVEIGKMRRIDSQHAGVYWESRIFLPEGNFPVIIRGLPDDFESKPKGNRFVGRVRVWSKYDTVNGVTNALTVHVTEDDGRTYSFADLTHQFTTWLKHGLDFSVPIEGTNRVIGFKRREQPKVVSEQADAA
ncbi:MAG: hypothetical protein ABIT47_01705 [Candidatus Paceibacterota bacterium]